MPSRDGTQAERDIREAAEEGDLATLKRLVAEGVNVNATDYGKRTALHNAASNGHAPCAESLLKAGADASLKDNDGDTALDDAKSRNHPEVVKLLENFAAQATAKKYGLLEPLDALELGADELSRVTAAAVAYCDAKGSRSVADLVEYEQLDGLVASLTLKDTPAKKLRMSLKKLGKGSSVDGKPVARVALPSSGDMAKPSVAGENVARFSAKEMEVAIDELNDGILGRERLAYHFTSKETAACIMSDVSFGLRASKEGQMGGGLFMCKTPPHQMGWDSYGGPAWREGVGKKLWGTKWEEVLLGNEHADKLEAVIIVRIPKSLFDNKARVLDGRESILVIPNHDPNLTKHGDDFYLAKENVVKVYTLDSEEEKN